MMLTRSTACGLAFSMCLCARMASAQVPVPPPMATPLPVVQDAPDRQEAPGVGRLLKDLAGDFRRLPSERTYGLLSLGATMAAFGHQFDESVTRRIGGAEANATYFKPGAILGGGQFQFASAIATYGVGRVTGKDRVARVGANRLRAQTMAQVVTGAIKVSASRARPDGSSLSFPSGHTSVSFASATVLHREFGWKVGAPAYAVASYIALSRVEHRRHYLSDVVFGAAIGLAAGYTPTIGRGDVRFAVTPVPASGGAGVSFTWIGR
jgi:membrane-associated phospholipid phosphatase